MLAPALRRSKRNLQAGNCSRCHGEGRGCREPGNSCRRLWTVIKPVRAANGATAHSLGGDGEANKAGPELRRLSANALSRCSSHLGVPLENDSVHALSLLEASGRRNPHVSVESVTSGVYPAHPVTALAATEGTSASLQARLPSPGLRPGCS